MGYILVYVYRTIKVTFWLKFFLSSLGEPLRLDVDVGYPQS